MTIQELIDKNLFEVVTEGCERSRELTEVFCCDLLSVAMGKAPASGVWVTVMGNMNTLAVAVLTEVGCIILAEDSQLDEQAKAKALQEEITVLRTERSIFASALLVYEWMQRS